MRDANKRRPLNMLVAWVLVCHLSGMVVSLPITGTELPVKNGNLMKRSDDDNVEGEYKDPSQRDDKLVDRKWDSYEMLSDKPGVVEACDSENAPENHFIYCSGYLLQAVNYHRIFKDSKSFVDRPMKFDPKKVQENFNKSFPTSDITKINKDNLLKFVEENFDEPGGELESCQLTDWQAMPPELAKIKDNTLKQFALDLNNIWKDLCRRMKPEVNEHPGRHSLIYVENPFVIPGGRFLEFYYWDAYWIVKGLIASGMWETTKHMINNFVSMVERVGFVPNGGRVYYLKRSQPPLLIPMVYEYCQVVDDVTRQELLRKVLPTLEKEVAFWDEHRTVNHVANGKAHRVYQYRAFSNVPRPESYKEDRQLLEDAKIPEDKQNEFYNNIASAAESGWDFSSRWFRDSLNMGTIETTKILPVELNAYICWNFKILHHLHTIVGNKTAADHWEDRYVKFVKTFADVFYVEDQHGWYDYNIETKKHNTKFYASMATPLFTGCYDQIDLQLSSKLYDKMEEMGAFKYAGGIPTGLVMDTKQQWDFPNGWSPLVHMVVEGFRLSKDARMQQMAFQLAEKWVFTNYKQWKKHGKMWEKYNVENIDLVAGGGEYEVQSGFGWTNGAVMDMMRVYSDRLKFDEMAETVESTQRSASAPTYKGNTLMLKLLSFASLGLVFMGRFLA